MILLTDTTHILELLSTSTSSTDYYVTYADITTTLFTPGVSSGNIATATTTTILAAPAASTQRQVKLITIRNRGTAAQSVTIKYDVSGTERFLTPTIALAAGESLNYTDGQGFVVLDIAGRVKVTATESTGFAGRAIGFFKIGTASEAAASWYCTSKDGGSFGAWAVGTPGLNGRVPDGTTTTDGGCIPFQNPASGSMYLTDASVVSGTAHYHTFFDILWVNSGLTVTTTTEQAITSGAMPARDLNGSTDGQGLMIGLLVTAATTNAGAITNMTVNYTNSDGTAARTATVSAVAGSQFPITAVVGTVIWFNLAAGDRGVRSIQGITLGTSLVTGSVSLFVARLVWGGSGPAANIGSAAGAGIQNPGVRLYNGTALLHAYLSSATTATNVAATLTMMER